MTEKAAPAFDMAALASLISDTLDAKLAPLQAEIATIKTAAARQSASIPQMRPMEHANRPTARQVIADLNKGEERQNGQQVPIGKHGRQLVKWAIDNMQPAFENGQTVRVNLEALQRGTETNVARTITRKDGTVVEFPGPVTWGERLGDVDAVGQVIKRLRLEDSGEWSYIVRVQGLTPAIGMRFDESELLAA